MHGSTCSRRRIVDRRPLPVRDSSDGGRTAVRPQWTRRTGLCGPGWRPSTRSRDGATPANWVPWSLPRTGPGVAPCSTSGSGGGRTTALLRLVSSEYVGIDYTPSWSNCVGGGTPTPTSAWGTPVTCRDIADGSQGLVVFSNNGIDAVDHDGRQRVLAEAHRVLGVDGMLCYSTLNKDGPLFGAHPGNAPGITWEIGSLLPPGRWTPEPRRAAARTRGMRAMRNWRRLRGQFRDEGDWGLAPFAAHEFGLVTHFVTLAGARAELDRHGFEPRRRRAVRPARRARRRRGHRRALLPPGGPRRSA